jgi:hypothetical protein
MKKFSIANWVEQENTPRGRSFREAVHTILFAIANNKNLHAEMIKSIPLQGIFMNLYLGLIIENSIIAFSTYHPLAFCSF